MKNKKKKNIWIIVSLVTLILAIFVGAIIYISSNVNNYTYSQKKWISNNATNVYDIYIEQDLPIFANDGSGVFYDFLNAFRADTDLNFNISTESNKDYNLVNKNSVTSNDLVLCKDHFVVISNDSVSTLNDLSNATIGVFENDKESVSYYLTDYTGINYKNYSLFSDLKSDFNSKKINYIVVPMYKYLDEIVENDYNVVYHLDGLYSYYVLELSENNTDLNAIMTKFYNKWSTVLQEKINSHFLDIYYNNQNYTELQKEQVTNEDFTVGYIQNLPFEGFARTSFTGLTNSYLEKFSKMTGVTYKYVEYNDTTELSKALINKEVDIILNYYSLSNDNYESSRILGSTDYVVLANVNNNIVVNSLYSLVNSEVVMLSNMNLKYYMSSKNLFEIKDYSTVKLMAKNISDNSIIIVEKEVYDYYKDSTFKNYSIRYMDNAKLNNSFLLNKDNTVFNSLFNFYLSSQSSNEIKNESVDDIISSFKENKIISFIMSNLFFAIVGCIGLSLIIYSLTRRTKIVRKSKKEDKLFYFDTMTNLKNRNYLNENINIWNSTRVYPQTIIIIDIQNLKELNDKKGRKAGDDQIKSVANVLIRTQRDNSEILRTDGDEFMVYLVGYQDKQVSSYIHKLSKEFNASLADKDYGVKMGYFTIKDDLSTIDDAINEALSMIKKG